MKERPILFSSVMVKAILAGMKTQTRRIVKYTPFGGEPATWPESETSERLYKMGFLDLCPYGRPGDRLWVRETLRLRRRDAASRRGYWVYGADGAVVRMQDDDPRVPAMLSWAHHKEGDVCVSIHMPRWASRILLDVTEVRVQRLQDINDLDAVAEGVESRGMFRALWNAINGDRAPWSDNPWVWAVTFKGAGL